MSHVINTAFVSGRAGQHSRAFAPICTNSVVLPGHTEEEQEKETCVKSVHSSVYEVTLEYRLTECISEMLDSSYISCF